MNTERSRFDRPVRDDQPGIEQLVLAHRPAAYRLARAVLGDADSAEDVAQELSMRLATARGELAGIVDIDGWVYRVTMNLCRDRLRQRSRRERDVPVDRAAGERELAVDHRPEHALDLERARAAVIAAIARLRTDQQQMLTLRYVEGLGYAEIARLTSTPQGTVASRIFRALRQLGETLDPRHLEILK